MRNSKFIKSFWNETFFEMPNNIISSVLASFKFNYSKNKINIVHPYIFLCNKTTEYDKKLISNTINGMFVFLKDSVIQKIYENTLKDSEKEELIESFKALKEAYISVVIFPEKNVTTFGETGNIPMTISNFLRETTYDFKFISLVGTYFAKPVWSPIFRRCNTKFHQQFNVKFEDTTTLSNQEFNDVINNYMPSSATVYSSKYNPYIKSNAKAQNLETLFYCCSNCKNFFTVYSEFDCIKCNDCGSAVECTANGTFYLSKSVTDLASYAEFQYNELSKMFFDENKPLVEYKNINANLMLVDQISSYNGLASISIYCNRFIVKYPARDVSYSLHDIDYVEYNKNNTLKVKFKDDSKIYLSGKNKENFYIIHDLHKFIKQTKN